MQNMHCISSYDMIIHDQLTKINFINPTWRNPPPWIRTASPTPYLASGTHLDHKCRGGRIQGQDRRWAEAQEVLLRPILRAASSRVSKSDSGNYVGGDVDNGAWWWRWWLWGRWWCWCWVAQALGTWSGPSDNAYGAGDFLETWIWVMKTKDLVLPPGCHNSALSTMMIHHCWWKRPWEVLRC